MTAWERRSSPKAISSRASSIPREQSFGNVGFALTISNVSSIVSGSVSPRRVYIPLPINRLRDSCKRDLSIHNAKAWNGAGHVAGLIPVPVNGRLAPPAQLLLDLHFHDPLTGT